MDESLAFALGLEPAPPPSPTILLTRLPFSSASGPGHAHGGAVNGSNGNGHGHGFGPDDEFEGSLPGHGHKPLLRRMASIKKEPYFANLRQQLQEQLRSLDSRVETQALLTSELQEFFRRRAEVELEYSRSLDKLSKSLLARQKEVKQKREQVNLFSINNCWSQLITETKKQSQEHGVLSDIYSGYVTSRFSFVIDDLQRVYRKCRDIGSEAHEELLHVLHEFHTSTKTWHTYQAEAKVAENKLRTVEAQKAKLLDMIPPQKHDKSKKIRMIDKEIDKKSTKYSEARIKALKAKNEYLLCMDAANSAVQKYFVDDLSDLIDCMDLGFYQCITRIINAYISTQQQLAGSIGQNIDGLTKCVTNLDSRLDKQKFLEVNNSAFIMPKKLEFQGPTLKGEESPDTTEPGELSTAGYMKQELEQRLVQLHHRLNTLRTESDELWKTLETAESTLLEMLTHSTDQASFDIKQCLAAANAPPEESAGGGKGGKMGPESMQVLKWRADRHETDEFHLEKFHEYMLSTNRIARLQAKYDHIRKVLNDDEGGPPQGAPTILVQALQGQTSLQPSPYSGASSHSGVGGGGGGGADNNKLGGLLQIQQPRRRKRIGAQLHAHKKPKLFGGSLEEYIECTGQEIPTIMRSCIRIINLYGLHHQGLFRVSGSQVEINHFRDAFESGEDPLLEATDASDINSIAGVFKLYLRELREPLFPIVYFEQFMELAQLESKHQLVLKMRDLVKSLPRTVFVVLRYLFAFLNHLSEFSDENMMDPYNIAICFGPTLVPVPEDKDQILKIARSLRARARMSGSGGPVSGPGSTANSANATANGGPPPSSSRPISMLTSSDSVDLQVQYQNLVNELIKNLIVFAEEIFPNDGAGILYEKYLSHHPTSGSEDRGRSRGAMDASVDEEIDTSDIVLSDDESDSSIIEAVAQYNFNARSPRELSFSKGDCIRIYSQVSSDWWRGSVNGVSGLVPDKYISIVTRKSPRDVAGKSSGAKSGVGVAGTISDSFLNVGGGGGSKDFVEPSTSSKSSPVYYASETHPASRSHHGHPTVTTAGHSGHHGHGHGHGHQKSSSISSAGSDAPFGRAGYGSDADAASISSSEVGTGQQQPQTSHASVPAKSERATKEDILDDDDDEEASVSSSASRSHSLSISMPKSVENEAAPPQSQTHTQSQPLGTGLPLSGSQTLLAIREDEGDDDDDQCFAQVVEGPVPAPAPASSSKTITAPAPAHPRAIQQHSAGEAEYANMETYWEAMKQCKKPLPQYVGIRNGSAGTGGSHPDLVMDLPLPAPGTSTPTTPPLPPPAAYASIPRSTSCGSSDGDGSSDDSSNASSPTGSPDGGPGGTTGAVPSAAECFAKQNQCTLKKGVRNPVGPSAIAAAAAAGASAGTSGGGGSLGGGRTTATIQENPFMKQDAPPPTKKPQVKVKPVLKSSFMTPTPGVSPAASAAAAAAEFEQMLLARSQSTATHISDSGKKDGGGHRT